MHGMVAREIVVRILDINTDENKRLLIAGGSLVFYFQSVDE
jgi:hypothetical protein